jgi:hypothetical protein
MRTLSWRLVAALLAVCALGAVAAQELGIHTDDGCRVEAHCRLCRVACVTASVGDGGPLIAGPGALVDLVAPAATPPTAIAPAAAHSPRGPPRAS